MSNKPFQKRIIPLLRYSVNILYINPVVFFPFIITAFIQLLIIEILYFAPRYPLSVFFGPVIRTIWNETFMHYPFNFILLPKMFQYVQIPIYIFMSSFLIGISVAIVAGIHHEKKMTFRSGLKQALPAYVHVVVGAIISFLCYLGLFSLYGFAVKRAIEIRSETGVFYIIKRIILDGTPYVNLLCGVLVTALFAFVIPMIVIDRKKIFQAIFLNFKNFGKSLWFVFLIVLVPTLFYVPILLLRNNVSALSDGIVPGMRVFVIVLSVVVMVMIDAVTYTAITTHYLYRKENK